MILNTILLVLALAGAGALTYLFSLFNVWFWLLILPFWMVSYYILFALWIVFLVIWGKFLPKDGTPEKPNFLAVSVGILSHGREYSSLTNSLIAFMISMAGISNMERGDGDLYVLKSNELSLFSQ